MMNWDDLRFLLAVARTGSMSGAARSLGVNHATVIRRIRSLEEQLTTPLFDRSGHTYVITPAGQVAVDAAELMEAQSVGVERQVLGQATALSGTIKVTAPEPMGRTFLLPAIQGFAEQYPDILIDLSLSTRNYDLGMREADVAFRVTEQPPEDLVGNRLAPMLVGVYNRLGSSVALEDVHAVISQTHLKENMQSWEKRYFPWARVSLITDSPGVAADAIKEGFGASMLPLAIGEADPGLVRMRAVPVEKGSEIWLLMHTDVRSNARIRVFRDYMQDFFARLTEKLQGSDEDPSLVA